MKSVSKPLRLDHLIIRRDGVLCSNCKAFEPVHPGDGTPFTSMLTGYHNVGFRHKDCVDSTVLKPRKPQ